MKRVTDPELLAQLDGAPSGLKPVTDPALIEQLEAPQASLGERVAKAAKNIDWKAAMTPERQGIFGLTGRAAVRGVTAVPAMVGDALGLRSSDALNKFFDAIGLPNPENETERVAADAASGMAGAGGMVKLGQGLANSGNALVKRIGELLKTAPGTQVVAGGTGGASAGVTREAGGDEVDQLAAGMAGGLVPSMPTALAAATRATVRGGEAGRQRVARNIDTFEEAGAGAPTVGQATQSRIMRAIESTLAKAPGSAGRMVAKAENEAVGMGAKVENLAVQLAPRSGAETAGRSIKAGLKSFGDDFKTKSGQLYDQLDTHIAKDRPVDMTNTANALSALNADIPGAPALSKFFKNSTIQAIEAAMKSDTGEWTTRLPYEAMKKLRTLVGQEIENTNLVSSVPRSKWKALYSALSQDLGAAAAEVGPQAQQAFKRANKFYGAGMKRIDEVLEPILKKGDPEDIFKAAVSGTKEGATTIRGVTRSLPEESKKVLAATMMRRLGRATAGQQDDLGEVFSSETFLTNWNRIDQQAKNALFSSLPARMRSDLDKIAKAASNIREGSKVFANPSGTAQAVATTGGVTAFGVLLATGQLGGAAAVAAGAGLANLQARLMTSSRFVHWLAQSTRAPAEQLPAQLNQLFQQSLDLTGEDRRDVRAFITQAREAAATQRRGRAQ